MKRLILPVLLVFGIGLFSSCAKKSNPPANNTPTASMTASVSATAWTAKTVSAVANSVDITITGTSSDGSYMKFVLPPDIKAGTYALTESDNYTYQYVTPVTAYIVTSGTITVTSYANKMMTGTFSASVSANGSGTKNITSGSFTALF